MLLCSVHQYAESYNVGRKKMLNSLLSCRVLSRLRFYEGKVGARKNYSLSFPKIYGHESKCKKFRATFIVLEGGKGQSLKTWIAY